MFQRYFKLSFFQLNMTLFDESITVSALRRFDLFGNSKDSLNEDF